MGLPEDIMNLTRKSIQYVPAFTSRAYYCGIPAPIYTDTSYYGVLDGYYTFLFDIEGRRFTTSGSVTRTVWFMDEIQ